MRVSDVMHRGLLTCVPSTTLGDAAALLAERRVHALVVAEPGGPPLGVLADFDLLAGEWLARDEASRETMAHMTAGELMTAPPRTIDATADVREAAERLHRERLARLLVVDAGDAIGVVAVSDLVATLGADDGDGHLVRDAMSRGFVACGPDTPLRSLARAMSERRSRSVVVLGRQGDVLGVVTGTDLLPHVAAGETGATAADLLHPPLTIGPDATLREAADALVGAEVHRLVVVDPASPHDLPLGVLSTFDVVAYMARRGSGWRD